MKSCDTNAMAVYTGIFTDAYVCWPDLRTSLEKDFSYLRRAVEHRGLPFLTVTLPAFNKVLERALDEGRLPTSGYPQGIPLRKSRPKFLSGLLSRVFDYEGTLRTDADVDAVLFIRQILCLMKKYRIDCPPSALESSIDEFFRIEEHLPRSHPDTWDCEVPFWQERRGHPIFGELKPSDEGFPALLVDTHCHDLPWNDLRALCAKIVRGEIGNVPWWDLRPKHGPGAVSDRPDGGVKYDFPNWPRKLGSWFPFDWFGSGDLLASTYPPSELEPPSKLIAVPKDQRGPRLICAEPIAHQWMQQSIFRWLEGRVNQSSILSRVIDFRNQAKSRERARLASLDGKHATVDLSSASDRISTRLVEFVFQGCDILDGFHACRTRAMVQNITKKHNSTVLLRKFSTQGSALTFPVQTIVFTILTMWAVKLTDGVSGTRRELESIADEITVFGDDIIIPSRALGQLLVILHECGLKVNYSKTFSGISFRESCGMDAFKGHDVTPAYVLSFPDGSPAATASSIECANNLFLKGFWNASMAVDDLGNKSDLRRTGIKKVTQERLEMRRNPHDQLAVGGLFRLAFSGETLDHIRKVWHPDYHRYYAKVLNVSCKEHRTIGSGNACLTQYFTETPDPLLLWVHGETTRVKLRKGLTRVYL